MDNQEKGANVEPKKESAPGWQARGRNGKQKESSIAAMQSIAQTLSELQPLAHISSEYCTRSDLAKLWDCDIATVARRCRKAKVAERTIIVKGRARLEFATDDVRAKLQEGAL